MHDIVVVKPKVHRDERGFFAETFKSSDMQAAGIAAAFKQDGHSRSTQAGSVRGLHYQLAPRAQGKLVRCLRGRVFDVAVDIRPRSPTFGKHASYVLSDETLHALWIPPGFAHGFCALTSDAELLYKLTEEYAPDLERCIRWDDPALAIPWPTKDPRLSKRDAAAPLLADAQLDGR